MLHKVGFTEVILYLVCMGYLPVQAQELTSSSDRSTSTGQTTLKARPCINDFSKGGDNVIDKIDTTDSDPRDIDCREVTTKSITQSVTTSARCKEGFATSGGFKASAADIELVEQGPVGCDEETGGCKAWQITVKRNNPVPFDIDVWAVCSSELSSP